MLYAICSSIYSQRAALLKLLHSIFHHLDVCSASTLYIFTSLLVQEFLTTLYTSLEP